MVGAESEVEGMLACYLEVKTSKRGKFALESH